MDGAPGIQQHYCQAREALEGLSSAVHGFEQDLQSALADAEYWKQETETFRKKYFEERARNERLRRVVSTLQSPVCAASGLPHLLPAARPLGSPIAAQMRRLSADSQRPFAARALAARGCSSHDGAFGRPSPDRKSVV